MKRAHEPEARHTKNKRRVWPDDMAAMFKDLYEEALRKAEARIACHPAIFVERCIGRITRYHELMSENDSIVDIKCVTGPLIERNRSTPPPRGTGGSDTRSCTPTRPCPTTLSARLDSTIVPL
jgi:hypothetical protein